MQNNSLDIKLSIRKIQFFQDQKEFLKLKAFFNNLPIESKKEQFLIQIIVIEKGWVRDQFNHSAAGNEWIQATKKKPNKKEFHNIQNQPQILRVTWQIPIKHNYFRFLYEDNQNYDFNNQILLIIQYLDNEKLQQKTFEIKLEKKYQVQKQNEIAIEHNLTLIRLREQIPIKLIISQTLFKQNQKIEFKLEGKFSELQPPLFTAILSQIIIVQNKIEKQTTLIEKFNIDKETKNSITFQSNIPENKQIIPLYLGDQIQCQHIIQITITFQKSCWLDCWQQRIFKINVPIEILTQKQEKLIEQQNKTIPQIEQQIVESQEQQNINDQHKYEVIVLNDKCEIQGFFFPQSSDCYKHYLKKAKIVKN